MTQQVSNVVLVNSICAQTRRKGSTKIVPDNPPGFGLTVDYTRSRTGFFETPVKRMFGNVRKWYVSNITECSYAVVVSIEHELLW